MVLSARERQVSKTRHVSKARQVWEGWQAGNCAEALSTLCGLQSQWEDGCRDPTNMYFVPINQQQFVNSKPRSEVCNKIFPSKDSKNNWINYLSDTDFNNYTRLQ